MRQVFTALVILLTVAGVGLFLHAQTPLAQLTYPYEPGCAWIHPQAAACSFEMPSCPAPEEKYDLRVYNFRREEKICCCIPKW